LCALRCRIQSEETPEICTIVLSLPRDRKKLLSSTKKCAVLDERLISAFFCCRAESTLLFGEKQNQTAVAT
jgi:hypothetical protein